MKSLLTSLFILTFLCIQAQTELVLERVEGLSSNDRIEDIEVVGDDVWICSKDGIFAYDNHDNSLSQIIEHENALAIKVSKKGDIFSAYNDKTLYYNEDNLIDLENNFRKFKGQGFEFSDIEVYKRELWVGSNHGIFIYELGSKKLKEHYTTKNSSLKSDDIRFIIYSSNNESLWVGTAEGAFEISNRHKKWKSEYKGHAMIAATENPEGLWLLSDKELYLMINGREHPQGLKRGLFEGEVNDLALDMDNNLFIASDILTRYDPYKDKLDQYGENLGLAASRCLSLASDDRGALWLGTSNAGLFRIYSDSMEVAAMNISILLEEPISCPGSMDGSISLSVAGGTPPFKYFWERARLKGNSKPSQLKAGTYKITVEDNLGTRSYASIKIDDPKPLSFMISTKKPVSSQSKKDGRMIIRPRGGTAPYDVQWDSGETGIEARKLSFGFHYLTITDANGCSIEEVVEIDKPKILPELDIATLKVGQTLKINNLYFQADSSSINEKSNDVLQEVYDFLDENKSVFIEIGGHTNNQPTDSYCDILSTARAKTVAEFMYAQGIKENRISFKGYGKRKPIATNETAVGRRKNQRVEIKILRIES